MHTDIVGNCTSVPTADLFNVLSNFGYIWGREDLSKIANFIRGTYWYELKEFLKREYQINLEYRGLGEWDILVDDRPVIVSEAPAAPTAEGNCKSIW